MSGNISEGRKVIYYIGMVLMGLGFLSFISNFIIIPMEMDRMGIGYNMSQGPGMGGMAGRAILGIVLMIAGSACMKIGRTGLAGSGVILDPKRAREDLEPWNRAKGGMINDTIEEIDVLKDVAKNLGGRSQVDDDEEETLIKVRCQNCRALNDEDAKFCKACGKPL